VSAQARCAAANAALACGPGTPHGRRRFVELLEEPPQRGVEFGDDFECAGGHAERARVEQEDDLRADVMEPDLRRAGDAAAPVRGGERLECVLDPGGDGRRQVAHKLGFCCALALKVIG